MHSLRRISFLSILFTVSLIATGCFGLFGLFVPEVEGDLLINYRLEGVENPAESVRPSVSLGSIRGKELVRGPGVNMTNLLHGFSADGWDIENPSLEGAIENDLYFEFGFEVQDGFEASLTELDMWVRRSALSAPRHFQLQGSFDNFETPGFFVHEFEYWGRTSGSAPAEDPLKDDPFYYMENDLGGRPGGSGDSVSPGDPIPTVDLTAVPELQNIPGGTEVTFRLYGWGTPSTASTNTFAFGRHYGPQIRGTVQKID